MVYLYAIESTPGSEMEWNGTEGERHEQYAIPLKVKCRTLQFTKLWPIKMQLENTNEKEMKKKKSAPLSTAVAFNQGIRFLLLPFPLSPCIVCIPYFTANVR